MSLVVVKFSMVYAHLQNPSMLRCIILFCPNSVLVCKHQKQLAALVCLEHVDMECDLKNKNRMA